MVCDQDSLTPTEVFTDIIISRRGKIIRPKTPNQKLFVEAIRKNTIVFAIGPAGTGKTYLAMAMAVKSLLTKEVGRIILTRPAVEAGEKPGVPPGRPLPEDRPLPEAPLRLPLRDDGGGTVPETTWTRESSKWRPSRSCAGAP